MEQLQKESRAIPYALIRRDLEALQQKQEKNDDDETDEIGEQLDSKLAIAHQLIENYLVRLNIDRELYDKEPINFDLASPYIAASDALRKHLKMENNPELQNYPKTPQVILSITTANPTKRFLDSDVKMSPQRLAERPSGTYPQCVYEIMDFLSSCWPTIGVVVMGGIGVGTYYAINKDAANTLITKVSSIEKPKDIGEIFDPALTVYLSAIAATIVLTLLTYIVGKCCEKDPEKDSDITELSEDDCCARWYGN